MTTPTTPPPAASRRAVRLAPDLWALDLHFQGVPGTVAAYLYTSPDEGHTLVETGPGSTLPALRAAVAEAGARLEDVTQLAVTHIHLDHAGAAGALLRELPRARLLVHPAGAPHMIDPSKLMASATRIYGDAMDRLWGAFEPCPSDRVTVLEDEDAFRAGDRTLRALHTPGHASHHIAYHDEERGDVLTGDVAGVRLTGSPYVRPPTPPPDIDVEAWHASVERLSALEPARLLLTHFGAVGDADRHFDELRTRLDEWTRWVADRAALGEAPPAMAAELRRLSDDELRAVGADDLADAYELATPSGMTVDGLLRYLRKRAPAA